MTLKTSPLDSAHRALDAKMVPFGGWDMPLSYPEGTLSEHRACRSAAVVFDVSHLGTVRVEGPDAHAALQAAFTNDLQRIGPGRAQYTHLLDETGSVVDDIIVWWIADDRFDVMPNASNTDGVVAALAAGGVQAVDVTDQRAVIALQGPTAIDVARVVLGDLAEVGRFRVAEGTWDATKITVAGTGYTGERGIEVAVPAAAASALWDAFLAAGATPAGLGARDTLRLEAGLPLHGHELGPGITPFQAGLGWVVRLDKGEFPGSKALAAEKASGVHRRLVGLTTEGRRPPRADTVILRNGEPAGVVTSGNFSPMLGHGIALGFCPPDVAIGDVLALDMRGTEIPATVVALPFVTSD